VIGQAKRLNPEALIVATGCYASVVGEAIADERTLVIRNRDKDLVLMLVAERLNASSGRLRGYVVDPPVYLDLEKYEDRSDTVRQRAMVKAQDGCDSHCTYCIIPRARGRSRSLSPHEIVRRVQDLSNEGHAEVVITGVDLGSYGENEEGLPDLGGLLQLILGETDVRRIRVSSLEPGDFKESWLPLWSNRRLCRHLHVPLQSGSDTILTRMERRYSAGEFQDMVGLCREAIPGVTITTDVMVGFPGESDREFEQGYHFIRDIAFDGMHVFKYSQRSGTRAARMVDQVREETKQERSRVLREEAAAGVERLLKRHQGALMEVAWEDKHEAVSRGMTDTNVRVYGPAVRPGSLSKVRLASSFRDGLWAEPASVEIPLTSRL
jgi:threonylcarbamoyladenosine tRNA methylthiotransferase MtaB